MGPVRSAFLGPGFEFGNGLPASGRGMCGLWSCLYIPACGVNPSADDDQVLPVTCDDHCKSWIRECFQPFSERDGHNTEQALGQL